MIWRIPIQDTTLGLRPQCFILSVSTCHRSACTTTQCRELRILFNEAMVWNTKLEAGRLTFRLFHVYMCPLRRKVVFCKNIKHTETNTLPKANKETKHVLKEQSSTKLSFSELHSEIGRCRVRNVAPRLKSVIDISKQNYHSLKRSQQLFIKTKLPKLYTQIQQKGTQNILELHLKTFH